MTTKLSNMVSTSYGHCWLSYDDVLAYKMHTLAMQSTTIPEEFFCLSAEVNACSGTVICAIQHSMMPQLYCLIKKLSWTQEKQQCIAPGCDCEMHYQCTRNVWTWFGITVHEERLENNKIGLVLKLSLFLNQLLSILKEYVCFIVKNPCHIAWIP